jgi:ferredoxin
MTPIDIEQNVRLSWVSPSTRAFLEEARGSEGYSLLDAVHGYVYMRWPYPYISLLAGEHWLIDLVKPLTRLLRRIFPSQADNGNGRRKAADTYHAKVLTNEAARQLVMVKEDVSLRELEQVIPYRRARDIILKNPDHIVVTDCPCRSARPEPCSPKDVCLVVGEPFASFIAEHHPGNARRIDSEEACNILDAAHARGHVHHAFFNVQMLNRFFGICNCCTCCCVGFQAMRAGTPILAASGYRSELDANSCTGCGECSQACPFGAIQLAAAEPVLSREKCMGCGVCVSVCGSAALALVRDTSKGEPLDIRALMNSVDQLPER